MTISNLSQTAKKLNKCCVCQVGKKINSSLDNDKVVHFIATSIQPNFLKCSVFIYNLSFTLNKLVIIVFFTFLQV